MALAIVQTQPIGAGNLAAASPATTNAAITTTGGNLLVLGFRSGSSAVVTSISDPGGNTWIPLTQLNPFGVSLQMFYAKNITGWAAGNITVNYAATPANNPFGMVWEISGADAGNPFDAQAVSGSGGSTTVSTGNLVTNFPNDIVLAMVATNGANNPYVPPASYTQDAVLPALGANLTLGAAAHLITAVKLSGPLTYSWTVTSGTTASIMVAASFVASPRPALPPASGDEGPAFDFTYRL